MAESPNRSRLSRAAGLCAASLLLAACSSVPNGTPGRIPVVASTNVYGDIAKQLGGAYVEVTSILTDPNADPHLFEPGPANAALLAQARLVIQNGLGYDAFMDRLLAAAPNSQRQVIVIADEVGISGQDANPHLWYDVPQVPRMAKAIADALAAIDPEHEGYFQGRLSAFDRSLEPLQAVVDAIKAKDSGAPVAYTEPVPGYLLEAAGLVVLTPSTFSRAIEEGNDPSPAAVADMEALIRTAQVRVLLYNNQATSPITDRLRSLAQENGVPVLSVTETLPPGMTFQQWQLGQAQALARALGG
jgi:zinc/manganese transport system substrate-binding protein